MAARVARAGAKASNTKAAALTRIDRLPASDLHPEIKMPKMSGKGGAAGVTKASLAGTMASNTKATALMTIDRHPEERDRLPKMDEEKPRPENKPRHPVLSSRPGLNPAQTSTPSRTGGRPPCPELMATQATQANRHTCMATQCGTPRDLGATRAPRAHAREASTTSSLLS